MTVNAGVGALLSEARFRILPIGQKGNTLAFSLNAGRGVAWMGSMSIRRIVVIALSTLVGVVLSVAFTFTVEASPLADVVLPRAVLVPPRGGAGPQAPTSRKIQANGLTMTGLRGTVAASTSMTAQASALIMTGLRGAVPASTSLTVAADGLSMTGLRDVVPASTSLTVRASGLTLTGIRP